MKDHPIFGISQPNCPPQPNDRASIHLLLIEKLQQRREFGLRKYGTPLQAFNGRSALEDALDEVIDQAVYLLQEIEERKELERKIVELEVRLENQATLTGTLVQDSMLVQAQPGLPDFTDATLARMGHPSNKARQPDSLEQKLESTKNEQQ